MTHEQLVELLAALPAEHTFIKQVILAVWYGVVDVPTIRDCAHLSLAVERYPGDYPGYDYDLIRLLAGGNPDNIEALTEEAMREVADLYREVCGEQSLVDE